MESEFFVELKEHPGYFVSNMGRFRKGFTKILSTPTTQRGYCTFSVCQDGKRKFYAAHRIVAETFIGNLDGKEVNHKNFIKTDNRVENLEVVTRAENMRHYHSDERAKDAYSKIASKKTLPPEMKKPPIKKSKGGKRGGARPNTGPKRGASLPASGDLVKMPPIWLDSETLDFLRTLPNLSEFVRMAIKEKREREG